MSKKIQWRIRPISAPAEDTKCPMGQNLVSKVAARAAKGGLTVLISVLIIFTIVKAGSLTPSASPAATMNSLADIAGSGFSTATHSLKALYDKINTLVVDIWNKQTSELTSTGSMGKLIVDNINATISSRAPASTALSNATWTDARAVNVDKLDAAVSSRSTLTQSQIISDVTPFQGASIASILSNSSNTVSSLTGTYNASGVSSNTSGNVMEQLRYIRENFSGAGTCATTGYSCLHYGNNDASYVLTTAGGTYNATLLTTANVRSGVAFGVSSTGAYGGSGWTYGSDDAAKVLTTADANNGVNSFNAANLSVGMVKSGVQFGVGPLTGAYPSATYTLPSADATADLAASGGNISSSNGAVEWWQSDGTRQTATLDFPTLSNVCSGDTSNNSAGTLSVTAAYLSVGNTWCGTAGTLLANLFNGSLTAGGFSGGSQTNGGVDDYNAGNAAGRPTDSYSKGWTSCTSGADNYCGTNDPFADMKDNSTGLVWSKPCSGSGCSTSAEPADTDYSWDGTTDASNNSLTASVLCSQDLGTTHDAGWSLPHQKQLMQAYIDGSYGNLEATGVNRYYWSATTRSDSTTYAWYTDLSNGYTYASAKTYAYYVRCVRQP